MGCGFCGSVRESEERTRRVLKALKGVETCLVCEVLVTGLIRLFLR